MAAQVAVLHQDIYNCTFCLTKAIPTSSDKRLEILLKWNLKYLYTGLIQNHLFRAFQLE